MESLHSNIHPIIFLCNLLFWNICLRHSYLLFTHLSICTFLLFLLRQLSDFLWLITLFRKHVQGSMSHLIEHIFFVNIDSCLQKGIENAQNFVFCSHYKAIVFFNIRFPFLVFLREFFLDSFV